MVLIKISRILNVFLLCCGLSNSVRDIQCHDPDVGGTTQNKLRKFILFGSDGGQGAGIGNLLIFFPSVYYLAAFSGRDIILGDNSIVGEMCKIITCGFPFASEMAHAYPAVLADLHLKKVEQLHIVDFMKYIEGKRNITENVVEASGYKAESQWWAWYNNTQHCVQKLTGCDFGDIACSDRHAYQRLVRGPFRSSLTIEEEKRIKGVPDHVKHAILSLPHSFAPRLDAAVHIRNSFNHFEKQANISDAGYKKEVEDWLNSTECAVVFEKMKAQLVSVIEGNRLSLQASQDDDVYVYLAADNEQVKEAFASTILPNEKHGSSNFTINIMRVETKFVHHIKNLANMKQATNDEGLLDIVFDWYSLSLANTVIAWRKGFTGHVSTFVHSAQRVSGTTERTVIGAPIGHGIGTHGFQMIKDKGGRPKWDNMWSYSILDEIRRLR